jgi:hypothetical protein
VDLQQQQAGLIRMLYQQQLMSHAEAAAHKVAASGTGAPTAAAPAVAPDVSMKQQQQQQQQQQQALKVDLQPALGQCGYNSSSCCHGSNTCSNDGQATIGRQQPVAPAGVTAAAALTAAAAAASRVPRSSHGGR